MNNLNGLNCLNSQPLAAENSKHLGGSIVQRRGSVVNESMDH